MKDPDLRLHIVLGDKIMSTSIYMAGPIVLSALFAALGIVSLEQGDLFMAACFLPGAAAWGQIYRSRRGLIDAYEAYLEAELVRTAEALSAVEAEIARLEKDIEQSKNEHYDDSNGSS